VSSRADRPEKEFNEALVGDLEGEEASKDA
jgi:hypothetical protein